MYLLLSVGVRATGGVGKWAAIAACKLIVIMGLAMKAPYMFVADISSYYPNTPCDPPIYTTLAPGFHTTGPRGERYVLRWTRMGYGAQSGGRCPWRLGLRR